MVKDRHQIGIEGLGLDRARGRAADHGEKIGGVARFWIGRDGRKTFRTADRHGGGDGSSPDGERGMVGFRIRESREEEAHALHGGEPAQLRRKGLQKPERSLAPLAQSRRRGRDASPQQRNRIVVRDMSCQRFKVVSPQHEASRLAVHVAQHGFGSHDAIQSKAHADLLS
jgi:hypothetical protein